MFARKQTLTIANGATKSDAFDNRNCEHAGVVIPAAFTGASISFEVSADGATYQALYDTSDALVSQNVTQGRSYDLPNALDGWPFFKIVSASAEGAARSIVVVGKGAK